MALSLTVVLAGAVPACAAVLDEARALHAAGRLEEALAAYRAVARQAAGSDPASAAIALNNACVILMNTGDPRGAVGECQRALDLSREADDPRRLARALNNLGLALHYVGEYGSARDHFREALAVNKAAGDVESQVVNWANLGVTATEAGAYDDAIECHATAQRLAESRPDAPWSAGQVRLARINRAVVLERVGAYREALELYRRVLETGSGLDVRTRAALLVNLGVVHRNLGDPVRACASFEEAIETFGRLGDRASLSNAYLNLALVYHLNLGRTVQAEETYLRALALAREADDRAAEIQTLGYLGRALLDLERIDEAQSTYAACLAASVAAGSSEGRWRAREGLGRVALARGDRARALAELEQAIDEIETVRSSLDADLLRESYFADKRPVYALTIELLAALEDADPGGGYGHRAFEVVQRAKVRSLLDGLDGAGRHAEPVSAEAIAQRVGDGTLFEYFVGARRLFVWVVHRGTVTMVDLGPAEPVVRDVLAVHGALARGAAPSDEAVERLSNALLDGLEIPRGSSAELRIAADGALRYLPFELLRVPGRAGRPLVRDTAVSYFPSASSLAWLEREASARVRVVAGVGAPVLAGVGDVEHSPVALLARRWGLGELPGARAELAMVMRRLRKRGAFRVGEQATEAAFAELARDGARVLHVATHTVLDERAGHGAAILLTPTADSDGVLRPAEIAGLDCRVDLVVLSTCRSALGTGGRGDAFGTLTGAFLAAGSSGVVATLWDVGDAASAAFMEQFYFELGRGRTPAEALRRTKIRMLDDPAWSASPLWSGYVLAGAVPPVVTPSGVTLWSVSVAIVTVVALSGLLLWSRRKRVPGR